MIAHDLPYDVKCIPCIEGIHPHIEHKWASQTDIEFAALTHQLNPAGQECACPCARGNQ